MGYALLFFRCQIRQSGRLHDPPALWAAPGIFHWHNSSGRTMALGSTQPLTEMSTRNISWGLK